MWACLTVAAVLSLLIGEAAGQANRHLRGAQSSAVEQAKNAIISKFDPALPNMTLEAFLHYETDGALIEWKAIDCAPGKTRSPYRALPKSCVDVYSDLDRNRTIHIVVAIPSEYSALPELISVSLIEDGLDHPLKLIELPVALHGGRSYKVRVPRDLLPLQRVG